MVTIQLVNNVLPIKALGGKTGSRCLWVVRKTNTLFSIRPHYPL